MKAPCNIQVINSLEGKPEYVLIPFRVYTALRKEIDNRIANGAEQDNYIPFALEDYLDNPVARARINARMTQDQFAQRLGVSLAYVSKLEKQAKVTAKVRANVTQRAGRNFVQEAEKSRIPTRSGSSCLSDEGL